MQNLCEICGLHAQPETSKERFKQSAQDIEDAHEESIEMQDSLSSFSRAPGSSLYSPRSTDIIRVLPIKEIVAVITRESFERHRVQCPHHRSHVHGVKIYSLATWTWTGYYEIPDHPHANVNVLLAIGEKAIGVVSHSDNQPLNVTVIHYQQHNYRNPNRHKVLTLCERLDRAFVFTDSVEQAVYALHLSSEDTTILSCWRFSDEGEVAERRDYSVPNAPSVHLAFANRIDICVVSKERLRDSKILHISKATGAMEWKEIDFDIESTLSENCAHVIGRLTNFVRDPQSQSIDPACYDLTMLQPCLPGETRRIFNWATDIEGHRVAGASAPYRYDEPMPRDERIDMAYLETPRLTEFALARVASMLPEGLRRRATRAACNSSIALLGLIHQ